MSHLRLLPLGRARIDGCEPGLTAATERELLQDLRLNRDHRSASMFSVGPNYTKLKTNLQLAINRLKLLGKRKHEMAQKMRKEIAEYILQNKEDRARIRVEHIIREDYSVEALELMESLCDLLLARFDLIQQMKLLDDGLEEAVNSVLWAGPRLVTEIPELKVISDQLSVKYGRQFVDACRENRFAKVNLKLLQKLSVSSPPKALVEKYLVEIAKSHGVPFKPNKKLLDEDDVAAAEALLIDFNNQYGTGRGQGGGGAAGAGGSGSGGSSGGAKLIDDDGKRDFGWVLPTAPMPSAPPALYPDVMSATLPQGPPLDAEFDLFSASLKEKTTSGPPPPILDGVQSSQALHMPDPPAYSLVVTTSISGGANTSGNGQDVSGGSDAAAATDDKAKDKSADEELDFEDLSRRFEQLRRIR